MAFLLQGCVRCTPYCNPHLLSGPVKIHLPQGSTANQVLLWLETFRSRPTSQGPAPTRPRPYQAPPLPGPRPQAAHPTHPVALLSVLKPLPTLVLPSSLTVSTPNWTQAQALLLLLVLPPRMFFPTQVLLFRSGHSFHLQTGLLRSLHPPTPDTAAPTSVQTL